MIETIKKRFTDKNEPAKWIRPQGPKDISIYNLLSFEAFAMNAISCSEE